MKRKQAIKGYIYGTLSFLSAIGVIAVEGGSKTETLTMGQTLFYSVGFLALFILFALLAKGQKESAHTVRAVRGAKENIVYTTRIPQKRRKSQ